MYSYFREHKADIIFVQESHCDPRTTSNWETEWGGTIIHSFGKTNARGVSIFFSKSLSHQIKLIKTETDHEGRLLLVQIRKEDQDLLLQNIVIQLEKLPVTVLWSNTLSIYKHSGDRHRRREMTPRFRD